MLARGFVYIAGEEISLRFQRVFFCAQALLFLIISTVGVFAQNVKLTVAPPSKWVGPIRSGGNYNLEPADPSTALRWLLIERQINAKSDEQFYHLMRQVVTQGGAQKASRVVIDYDPSYEALTLHWVRILRGTNVLNRLDFSKLQTNQRGVDTGGFRFGAERPATLLLDDVRAGDIIDYAYSIAGSNPILHGMFSARLPVQYEDPVEHFVARLLWPPPRKFYVQDHGTDIYPASTYANNFVEYVWNATAVPGLRGQPPMPVWYNPYPWVQLSEYQSWSDVNKWALKLFAASNAPSAELAQKIDEWKELPRPEDRAVAALEFAQDQIRSSSAASGASDTDAVSPSEVFARRFGNSREKTWLLAAMLRALSIEAHPVLVSTHLRQTVADLHPSPDLFDHAIVQATVNNQTYFLDPTTTYERGPLQVRSWANYGYGLVVRPGITALSVIPPCPVQPKTTVSEYFDVRGFDQETGVTIVTAAEGTDAQAMREHFVLTPLGQIEKDYLRAQEDYYPEIRSTAPLQFTDDAQNNRFQVTCSYAISKFWRRRNEESNFHCRFYSFNVDEAMHKPEDSIRTMPLAIDYPVHQLFHVEANWMTGWPVKPDSKSIQNPAFVFNRTMNITGTNLVVDHEYRSLSDAVMPEAFPTYRRQLDAASQYLGCTVVSY